MPLQATDESLSVCESVELCEPSLEDASAIWSLVDDSGVLDRNSGYAYLLLCKDFSRTCLVAKRDGDLLGFVTGYIPPGRSDTLFLWQIGVAEAGRRQGLARRMALRLVRIGAAQGARFLELTIDPANTASRRLFASVADRLDAPIETRPCFSAGDFPCCHEAGEHGDEKHGDEELVRIGPFSPPLHDGD